MKIEWVIFCLRVSFYDIVAFFLHTSDNTQITVHPAVKLNSYLFPKHHSNPALKILNPDILLHHRSYKGVKASWGSTWLAFLTILCPSCWDTSWSTSQEKEHHRALLATYCKSRWSSWHIIFFLCSIWTYNGTLGLKTWAMNVCLLWMNLTERKTHNLQQERNPKQLPTLTRWMGHLPKWQEPFLQRNMSRWGKDNPATTRTKLFPSDSAGQGECSLSASRTSHSLSCLHQ